MLRPLQTADLDAVMAIWLAANLEAHPFVSADYWRGNFAMVRQMLPQAQVYVYEADKKILGFIGLDDDYIAGIFVAAQARSRGIGKQLLDFAKTQRPRLTLRVYKQNERAVQFYQREGFRLVSPDVDMNTGAEELAMLWQA